MWGRCNYFFTYFKLFEISVLTETLLNIIVLTETRLDENTNEVFYSIDGYNVYRTDRSGLLSARSSGGGTLIAVSTHLIGVPVPVIKDGVEDLFIKVSNRCGRSIFEAA